MATLFRGFAKIGVCRAIDRAVIESMMIANRKKIDDLV